MQQDQAVKVIIEAGSSHRARFCQWTKPNRGYEKRMCRSASLGLRASARHFYEVAAKSNMPMTIQEK